MGCSPRSFLVRICFHSPCPVHRTRIIHRYEGSRALSTCGAPRSITLQSSPQGVSDVARKAVSHMGRGHARDFSRNCGYIPTHVLTGYNFHVWTTPIRRTMLMLVIIENTSTSSTVQEMIVPPRRSRAYAKIDDVAARPGRHSRSNTQARAMAARSFKSNVTAVERLPGSMLFRRTRQELFLELRNSIFRTLGGAGASTPRP